MKVVHFLKYNLATGFGTGRIPIASGTFGSLLAVLLAFFFWPANGWVQLALVVAVTAIAIHTSGWLAEAEGESDPSIVVIDEIAGQFTAYLFLPVMALTSWKVLLVGFLLFRVFDIWKPWPVNRLEALPGGLGIVLDDIMAGIYANILLQIWLRLI